MVASLDNHDVVTVDEVHKSVFLVDTARPGACQCMTELLGLPDPGERITGDVIEQTGDALQCIAMRSFRVVRDAVPLLFDAVPPTLVRLPCASPTPIGRYDRP